MLQWLVDVQWLCAWSFCHFGDCWVQGVRLRKWGPIAQDNFPAAAAVGQAAKLAFSLQRGFQRLGLSVALCSRGRVMQALGRKEEQHSSGLAAGHRAVQV